ncbi:MAG: B12-binding domain-containing radical SAM protein [Synechococcus lacustris]
MRVLLVYPRFPKTFWSFHRALELVGKQVLMPPLGLITVAALLPPDWSLKLVDNNIRAVSSAEWAWADLVIFSAMLVQKRDLAAQIQRAKSHGLAVAVGGPFASSSPNASELNAADFLILDEGELTIPAFLTALQQGAKNGHFSAGAEKPDISTSPIPRFDLLERSAYDIMPLQFSRGCPFQCEFCDIIVLYGRKPRTKTPDQLLKELDTLYELGWRGGVFLVDDNFIGNKRNVKLLLPELLSWQQEKGFPFAFTTEASVDLASDEPLMQLMAAARFDRVFLGIETPDSNSLTEAGKLQNTRNCLEESVDTITGHGLQVMAGFILGFDSEKAGAGQRIVDFVTKTGIPIAMLGILQALPNTALWHRLQREGRLIESPDSFDEGVQTHLLNFRPSRPMPEIAAEFVGAFSQLYEPRAYLERIYGYCQKLGLPRWQQTKKFRNLPTQLAALNPAAIKGMLTILWRQGVRRESRWLFWRQLSSMLLTKPARLKDYFWMLLLDEHFLDYQSVITEQINGQLRQLSEIATGSGEVLSELPSKTPARC